MRHLKGCFRDSDNKKDCYRYGRCGRRHRSVSWTRREHHQEVIRLKKISDEHFFNWQVCAEATNLYVPTRENVSERKSAGTFSHGASAKEASAWR